MRLLKLAVGITLLFAYAKSYCQPSSIEVLSWNVFLRPSVMSDGQMNVLMRLAAIYLIQGQIYLSYKKYFTKRRGEN